MDAVTNALDARRPESVIEPSLDRIRALVELLGQPQHACPVLHIAGTNGKSSVTRIAESLLQQLQLRTGRFSSPHLQTPRERIGIDGAPVSEETYVSLYQHVAPLVDIVDAQQPVAMSTFEVLTGMAFAAFADAPVDAMVLEVGLGGSWDATNVADAAVAAITPIALDHAEYLGTDLAGIAREKAGIIKPGSIAVMASQTNEVAAELLEAAVAADATVAREGMEFGVLERRTAVGGQQLRLQGLSGVVEEVFLPLHGAHQASNAALALAAVEAFVGAGAGQRLDPELVREAMATVTVPGRLERVRSSPAVFLDAAHNPHGSRALAASLSQEFDFRTVVLVVAALREKESRAMLAELEPAAGQVVITQNSSPRCMDADELATTAVEVFGGERVLVEPRLDGAVEEAIRLVEESAEQDGVLSGAAVVITGSVVTAGDARTLFGKEPA